VRRRVPDHARDRLLDRRQRLLRRD
jgi:hypothetical protein